jgi:hypothetical protein
VREEHGKYFEALEKHPRLLVGQEVPRINGEGMERLGDTADAKEWQEAIKSVLIQEIRDRAEAKVQESSQFMETVHASIDLFKNNPDLIPGTKNFDRDLAEDFAQMAKPYELRNDQGKLQGYTIPVQPIIENLRAKRQAAKPPSPAVRTARQPAQSEPPQAAVPSKAGAKGGEKEDFSTLFGTIGLPNIKI